MTKPREGAGVAPFGLSAPLPGESSGGLTWAFKKGPGTKQAVTTLAGVKPKASVGHCLTNKTH